MAVAPGDIRWYLARSARHHSARHLPRVTPARAQPAAGPLRDPRRHQLPRRDPGLRRAGGLRTATGSTRRSSRATARCTSAASRIRVEAWQDGVLVGGLYGVALQGAFFGESMFHRVSDASKAALAALVDRLRARGYALLDTQWVDGASGAVRRDRDPAPPLPAAAGRRAEESTPASREARERSGRSVNGVGFAEGERRDLRVELLAVGRSPSGRSPP